MKAEIERKLIAAQDQTLRIMHQTYYKQKLISNGEYVKIKTTEKSIFYQPSQTGKRKMCEVT
jgi:hypothetical protein